MEVDLSKIVSKFRVLEHNPEDLQPGRTKPGRTQPRRDATHKDTT